MKSRDLISGIVLFLFGMGVFVIAWSYPLGTFRMPGGGFFPLIASILLMALAGILMGLSFSKKHQQTNRDTPFFPAKEAPIRVVIGFLSLIGYRYLLPVMGFTFATGFFVFILVLFLGNYNWKFSVVFSILTAVIAYYLFQVWLQIPLPVSIFSKAL